MTISKQSSVMIIQSIMERIPVLFSLRLTIKISVFVLWNQIDDFTVLKFRQPKIFAISEISVHRYW